MIEVGEYIRTKLGHIGIVKRIEFDNIDKSLKWYVFDYKEPEINRVKEEYINKPYITKHSKNIVDLIEAGDIVELINGLNKNEFIRIQYLSEVDIIKSHKIKTILTHELYEQNSYKVVK